MKDLARGTGGEDPISVGLSSEYAGVCAADSGERPSSWLGERGLSLRCWGDGSLAESSRLPADSPPSPLTFCPRPGKGPMGTGVGALGTSWRWLPPSPVSPAVSWFMPMGRKLRRDPDVLAATRSDSGSVPKALGLALSTWVTLALFLGGPSSPSVPSSYPDVFPSKGNLRGRPTGRPVLCLLGPAGLLESLLEGRDVGPWTPVSEGGSAGMGAKVGRAGAGMGSGRSGRLFLFLEGLPALGRDCWLLASDPGSAGMLFSWFGMGCGCEDCEKEFVLSCDICGGACERAGEASRDMLVECSI